MRTQFYDVALRIRRVALQRAFKKGYVVNNVADRVDRPKKEEPFKCSFYDIHEIEELFHVAKGTNLELPIHLAVYYGLRREEVIGLKWGSIDFQYRTMTIMNTVLEASVDGEHKLLLKETTKNDSSFRTMPLSQKTIGLLLEKKLKQDILKEISSMLDVVDVPKEPQIPNESTQEQNEPIRGGSAFHNGG